MAGRKSNRQKFIEYVFNDIETNSTWDKLKIALYKESILHYKTNSPKWLYDTITNYSGTYWDFMNQNIKHTKEELITDMGYVLEGPVIDKILDGLDKITVL